MEQVKARICVLPIMAILLSQQLNSVILENDVKNYIDPNPISTSEYIENNLNKIVTEFNKVSLEKWNATYIENKIKVIDTINKIEYAFLDFDRYSILFNGGTFGTFVVCREYGW